MNLIQKINNYDLCSGCGICEGLIGRDKISVQLDDAGFLRPKVSGTLTKLETSFIRKVCPGLDVRHSKVDASYDSIWGPVRSIHTACAVDHETRRRGSSGGVLTALLIFLLETEKVDFVVATTSMGDDPLGTKIAICHTREEIIACAGSRYAPSAPLKDISNILDFPGRFAFVGKPCDVAALRRLSKFDERVDGKVAFLLSFMCAGVPSRNGSESIVRKLGANVEDVVHFRYRGDGWPGLTKATLKDGRECSMTYDEAWGGVLARHVQWRCKLCPDGTGEFADITCADAWEVNSNGLPDFTERDGKSFVIARTEHGSELVAASQRLKAIKLIGEAKKDDLSAVQFHQCYRRKTMVVRYLAMLFILKRFPKFNFVVLAWAGTRTGLWSLLRAFSGSLIRGLDR